MYLVVNEIKIRKDKSRVFSVIYLDTDKMELKTYTSQELKEVIQRCEEYGEIINADVDNYTDEIQVRISTERGRRRQELPEYIPLKMTFAVQPNCAWSVLSKAVTDGARLVTGKGEEPIKSVKVDKIGNIININNSVYSQVRGIKPSEVKFRYKDGSKVFHNYQKMNADWYKILPNNEISFDLTKMLVADFLNEFTSINPSTFTPILKQYLVEYDSMLVGYRFAACLNKPSLKESMQLSETLSKLIFTDEEMEEDKIRSFLGKMEPKNVSQDNLDFKAFLRGAEEYLTYGYDNTQYKAEPTENFVYRGMENEKFIVSLYFELI